MMTSFTLRSITRTLLLTALSVFAGNSLVAQIYFHNFGTTSITTKPYTGAPVTIDANLSSSSWTTSGTAFGGFAGNGGGTSQCLSANGSSGTSFTLTFNVASGYQLDVTSFNFWRIRSASGATNWNMTINGIAVGSGLIPATAAFVGVTSVANPVSGLTGVITVVYNMTGGGSGTARLDDFTLNGSVTPTAPAVTPSITTISPNNATAGGAGFTLTVNGADFVSGSTVNWNGTPRTTTFVSATQLTAAITGGDIATAGTASVTVVTPTAPSASNAVTFTINPDLTPTLTASALTAFGAQCINGGPYGPNSFTITGSNLTGANVTVGALAGYTYSTTALGTYTSTLSLPQAGGAYSQAIYVHFEPITATSYNGNIAVGGGGASSINVAASGSGVNTAPTGGTGAASAITSTSATVSGTLNTATSCGTVTAYGIEYSTTLGFANGSGTAVPSTNLTGTSFSSDLVGLAPCTNYYVHAYATRASGTIYGAQVSFTTAVIDAPTATAGTSVGSAGFTANWSGVTGATGYLLDVSTSPTFGSLGAEMVGWDFNDADEIADSGIPANSTRTFSTTATGPITYPAPPAGGFGIAATGWEGGSGSASWVMDFSTTGYAGLTLSSLQRSSAAGPKDFKIQYRIGTGGTWTDVPGGTVTVANNYTTGKVVDLPLPSACDNEAQVFVRWIMTSNNRATGAGVVAVGGVNAMDDVTIDAAGAPSFVPGYNNLPVGGTSQVVSGLDPLTTYYYRVNTVGANCTSNNSNVIEVTTTVGASPLLTAGTLADFGTVCVNADGGPSSFTLDGFNLTTANITVAALAGFSYSTTELGTYTSTLSIPQGGGAFSQDIWVKFTPTLAQAYDGNISVGGGGAPSIDVAATGSGIDTEPTLTTGAASAITEATATVAGQINTAGCGTITAYGIEYSTTMGFTPGSGTQVASTNLVGADYTSDLAGLSSCTAYYYVAYATRASGTTYGTEGTFTTETIDAPVATAGTGAGYYDFTANWNAVPGATGYYIDVSTAPDFGTFVSATDLIISEYVEGSGNNKYIELYNGTGNDVDLSNYTLNRYNNGATSASNSDVLSGTLPNNSTIVYANSGAVLYGGATTNSSICSFNGNDAISLTQTVGSGFVDIFGTIGQDPGAAGWISGSLETTDRTLVRKPTVTGGITSNPAPGFPGLATEWIGYDVDDVSSLGSHSFDGFIPSFVTGYQNLSVGNVLTLNVTGLDPGTIYYYRVRAISGSCTSANSNTISISTLAIDTYYSRATGFMSDDIWSDTPTGVAGPAVFTATSGVVIQTGNVVTSSGNVDVEDLTVETGGELVLNASHNVKVNGNAEFDGTVTANNNSTLSFVGTGGVFITSTNPLALFNLTANVPGDLYTDATIQVRGTLLLQDGDFDVSTGSLTLTSTATRTGRLGPVGATATFTGDMTVQRYIPAGGTNWRFLGSAVSGRTVSDWQDDFITAGYPGSAYPNFDRPVGSGILWPSVRYYDETVITGGADGGLLGVTSGQALSMGQGFQAWSGDNFTTTAAFTVDVTGAPHIAYSPITLPMSFTSSGTTANDGWNLVSNPVPSAIDFTLINRGTDVQNAYWVFDPVAGNLKSWTTGVGQGSLNGIIQSSQGFYLKADGAALTTTVSESAKVNDGTGGSFGGSENAVLPILSLTLNSDLNSYSDEATIVFANGTPDYDAMDALKFTFKTVGAPQVSILSNDGQNLAVDFFGDYTSAIQIPLLVNADITGTYTLSASIAGIDNLSCLSIQDLQTGTVTALTDGATYSFTINANDDATSPRFLLNGTAPMPLYMDNALCSDQDGAATVVVNNGPVTIQWTDVFSNVLLTQSNVADGVAEFTAPAGDYMIRVTPGGACGELVSNFTITAPSAIEAGTDASATTCPNGSDGTAELAVMGGNAPYTYLWSNGSTSESIMDVAGNYTVDITDANGCTLQAAVVVPAGEGTIASFETAGTTVVVNTPVDFTNTTVFGEDYTWDFGDGTTSNDVNTTHTWTIPGTYTVTLTATGGACADAFTMDFTVDATTAIEATTPNGPLAVWATPDHIVIEHSFNNSPVNVDIYDATGRLAISQGSIVQPGRILINDRNLNTGVWFVRVTSGEVVRSFRVPLMR